MGKRVFILDRPDFIRDMQGMPESTHRDQLADQLRSAWSAYNDHRARRPQILADLEVIGRKIAENPSDTKTGAQAAALSAELAVHPKMLEERARAYADALVAWSAKVWSDAQFVYNDAVDMLNDRTREFMEAAARRDRVAFGSAEYTRADEAIRAIRREDAPRVVIRDLAHRVMGAVNTNLTFELGAKPIHGLPQDHYQVDHFVRSVVKAAA